MVKLYLLIVWIMLTYFSGNARSLWMGVAWALTSGSGVALALLLGASGPLIGVAISASLLPPVVNCVSIYWWKYQIIISYLPVTVQSLPIINWCIKYNKTQSRMTIDKTKSTRSNQHLEFPIGQYNSFPNGNHYSKFHFDCNSNWIFINEQPLWAVQATSI